MAKAHHSSITFSALVSILLALAIGSAPVFAALSLQTSVVGVAQ